MIDEVNICFVNYHYSIVVSVEYCLLISNKLSDLSILALNELLDLAPMTFILLEKKFSQIDKYYLLKLLSLD